MKKSKNSKSMVRSNNTGSAVMKPQLTSLIDVMTILLVFLLKSFSTDGALITVSPEMDLAESISKTSPNLSLNVEITAENILVDGIVVVSIDQIESADSMFIEGIYNSLVAVKSKQHPNIEFGQIMIQCDRGIDFKILKKVMFTCGKAKLQNFSLLVTEKV